MRGNPNRLVMPPASCDSGDALGQWLVPIVIGSPLAFFGAAYLWLMAWGALRAWWLA